MADGIYSRLKAQLHAVGGNVARFNGELGATEAGIPEVVEAAHNAVGEQPTAAKTRHRVDCAGPRFSPVESQLKSQRVERPPRRLRGREPAYVRHIPPVIEAERNRTTIQSAPSMGHNVPKIATFRGDPVGCLISLHKTLVESVRPGPEPSFRPDPEPAVVEIEAAGIDDIAPHGRHCKSNRPLASRQLPGPAENGSRGRRSLRGGSPA